ncbi:related to putative transporter SEO1 [Phialocephala subalpina]|uniref:Related to putative transporter SEO1 n=1 Tax=Phialocephala subalpina TaxID=576137 RepID=A0A1L7XI09_9HELO|nr:related to putative transporter SEO1 [Phialocephala subalpina]
MVYSPARKSFSWYSPDDTPAERKLLVKLDILIVGYAFVVLWVKYIDQTNINNAYVSGLSEDLNFHGNQLVQFQTMFVVANVVGLIPFAYLFPKVPMFWLIPGLEFGWGIFTLLQFQSKSYSEIMAYRFIIGLFEAPYYSAVHFVLGSWYRSDELARRGGVFQAAISLGTLTASLLQSASSKGLDGVNGLSGWRWNFIITAIFPLALAPIGYFIWPGTPDKPNMRVISQAQLALAKSRFEKTGGRIHPMPFSLPPLKRIFSHKKVYILVGFLTIVFNCSFANGAFLLWVKSLKRFSIPEINNLGTIPPAVGMFFCLFVNFSADMAIGRTVAFISLATLNFTVLVILAIWNVPEGAKWFAFAMSSATSAMIPLIYSWANTLLRGDVEERALTLVLMQIIATSTNAWIPLLVWPTVESPKYPKGYPYASVFTIISVAMALSVRFIYQKEESKSGHPELEHGDSVSRAADSSSSEVVELGNDKSVDVQTKPI